MKNLFARISNFPIDFLKEVEDVYIKCQSINNISQWFNNLNSLSISIANGKSTYRQVETLIFELKVINLIKGMAQNFNITYEPKGKNKDGKTCDLLLEGQKSYLIELKSFHPNNKYTPIPYEHITDNNELIMDGYCYHDLQSVRGHLIDETLDTERKIQNYSGQHVTVMGVLLGYYLHLEDFRDFVTIYRKGHYRFDDPLGKMSLHNLNGNFEGCINEFWGFPFDQVSFDLQYGKKAVNVSLIQGEDNEIILKEH